MNILIAEDEEQTANAYKIALESKNHDVITVTNGEDALKIYEDKTSTSNDNYTPYDVIILDYKLPKMDGLEVAKKILEKNSKQVIIIVSAFVKEVISKQLKYITVDEDRIGILSKPFDIMTLLNRINHIENKFGFGKI